MNKKSPLKPHFRRFGSGWDVFRSRQNARFPVTWGHSIYEAWAKYKLYEAALQNMVYQ